LDWDDLKILLALSRKGSARGAAQALGVSNSTVTRRLDEMERVLGTHLFDRTPDGYRMTAAAEAFLPTAEHVEELVLSAERKVTGGDQELEGTIRLTLPPTGGLHFLVEELSEFSEQYPLIELELMASNDALDLSRREADIAIRVMPQGVKPPEYLIGRYISPISASTYVHRSMLNPNQPEDTSHLTWIGKNPGDQVEAWLANTDFPDRPVRHAIDNLSLVYEAVNCKMGMAYMPCFMSYNQPDVIRIPGARINHDSDMWVLTHKDLRLSARMRVLRDVIARAFASISHQLDSRPPE
jgi:DNA-binding transcriptional LysR family regulator